MHVHRSFASLAICGLSWTLVLGWASSQYTEGAAEQDFKGVAVQDKGRSWNGTDLLVFTPPHRINVQENEEVIVQVMFTTPGNRKVSLESAETSVATVDQSEVYLDSEVNGTGFNVTVYGVFVSYTKIFFKVSIANTPGG
ncbi:hypothetical protein MTO96_018023 [Rhipicephalus appendiculatus]